VAGGYNDGSLSSTEVLLETGSGWSLSGELPSPRTGLRAATVGNKIVMTGGQNGSGKTYYYDDILEYDPLTGQWQLVDRMLQARDGHAISVISNFEFLC